MVLSFIIFLCVLVMIFVVAYLLFEYLRFRNVLHAYEQQSSAVVTAKD